MSNHGPYFFMKVKATNSALKLIEELKAQHGEELLTLYQFKTKTAQHYFCKVCGIHTHNRPRSNPKIHGVNIACVEGIKPFEIENVPVNDGENHPLDQKK